MFVGQEPHGFRKGVSPSVGILGFLVWLICFLVGIGTGLASIDGQRVWKLYGGDFESGLYGASQGMGGLLATVEEANSAVTPLITDHFGHVQGRVSGGVVQWNGIELNSYGHEATGTVPALTSAALLPETLTLRGQRTDPTGLINLGMRPYDPESGRFMAPDPLGHAGSLSLYDYADGDPINKIDPDGRVAKGFLSGQSYNAGSMF
jgi:RHS repeat-associated protein